MIKVYFLFESGLILMDYIMQAKTLWPDTSEANIIDYFLTRPGLARLDGKALLFIFKVLTGLVPSYLSHLVIVHQPVKNLRSADKLKGSERAIMSDLLNNNLFFK